VKWRRTRNKGKKIHEGFWEYWKDTMPREQPPDIRRRRQEAKRVEIVAAEQIMT